MKDRVSTYPGRVKLVPVSGQANTYDLTRADEPVEAGTPLNKAALLSDAVAGLFGLSATATPNDVLNAVKTQLNGKAPTNHRSTGSSYGAATGSYYGHVKLSDSTASTSGAASGVAATPAAVKAAMDAAKAAKAGYRIEYGKATTGANGNFSISFQKAFSTTPTVLVAPLTSNSSWGLYCTAGLKSTGASGATGVAWFMYGGNPQGTSGMSVHWLAIGPA